MGRMGWFTLIHGKTNLKTDSGFTLLEVLFVVAMMGVLTTAYMQISKFQRKNTSVLQVSVARTDIEKTIQSTLSNGAVCSFILKDASQSSTASPPNRTVDEFVSNTVTAADPLIINITKLLAAPVASAISLATVGKAASALESKLTISQMKFVIKPNMPPDNFIGSFHIEFNPIPGMKAFKPIVIKNIQIITDSLSPPNAKTIVGCSGWGESRAHRYTFTTTSTWTVPEGTRKAFITMAGGGGSGLGWRVASYLMTGHSAGYVFSQPINVTPGEVMQVIIGKGGRGYAPFTNYVLASPGAPYYIFLNPVGDDGLSGYPGESSQLISPRRGLILECAGGSGAVTEGVDSFTGYVVAGDLPGALIGSGTPDASIPISNRVAAGVYAKPGGPGSCGPGPSGYGIGNSGITLWGASSGSYTGGLTPFGYGSGGEVSRWGCFVNPTVVGSCTFPSNGRDGVVFIDTW
jgi:prepilin-type N-terminal cleavage/methylation domain-containing protein